MNRQPRKPGTIPARKPSKSPPKRPRPRTGPSNGQYARPRTAPSYSRIAETTTAIAPAVLHTVLSERQRLAHAIGNALEGRGTVGPRERVLITRGLAALMRWWGWIEPLHLKRVEEQLLLASLLDSVEVDAIAREWAARIGRHPDRLVPVGDAPNWTGRAEGLKRWTDGRAVNADPWRLFPNWLRDHLPVPPGDSTPKAKKLDFLAALQARPSLWVAVYGADEKTVWAELREAELKPWIHRRMARAGRLPAETDLSTFEAYRSGLLAPHDIASQAVALVCDPDPKERWWDLNAGTGLHTLGLADRMKGKGLVVATFAEERQRKSIALKLRGTPFHNITTRIWDGRHVAGKAEAYDGVLVDAVSSGIGQWRRSPDGRWTTSADQIPKLAALQLQWLEIASAGVRVGGTLVYTVATVTPSETTGVVSAFLASHSQFQLQPFPHPLEDSRTAGTVQLWPHIHDGEARFIARMTRVAAPKKDA